MQGMDRAGRSVRVDPERTRRQLAQAGFVDIRENTIRCCLSPWSEDKDEADASRWFNFGITNGLQALALIPMIDHGDLGIEQVQDLCRRAEHEVCHLKYHIYMTMYARLLPHPSLRQDSYTNAGPILGTHGQQGDRLKFAGLDSLIELCLCLLLLLLLLLQHPMGRP